MGGVGFQPKESMSYREHVVWTRLPEGFTREELHGSKVFFGDQGLSGVLDVGPKPGEWFELSVVHERIDRPSGRVIETILHQTSERLFLIERLSSPGEVAFRLSFHTPSSSPHGSTRAVLPEHCDPTDQE